MRRPPVTKWPSCEAQPSPRATICVGCRRACCSPLHGRARPAPAPSPPHGDERRPREADSAAAGCLPIVRRRGPARYP
eukprot:scaffold40155_cov28-Tisochrysis_lutea.AAC.2